MIVKEFLNTWIAVGGVSITSSFMTYFFTRKKYNQESNNQELENVQKALEIYRGIIDDLRKEQAELKKEMREMRLDFERRLDGKCVTKIDNHSIFNKNR